MTEQHNHSPESADQPPVTAEQLREAQLLYKQLARFAATEGEEALLDAWADGSLAFNTRKDIEQGMRGSDVSFKNEGQYVGERTIAWDAPDGSEQDARLITCNESGIEKTGVLAQLVLSEQSAPDISVDHSYTIHPDMRVVHTVTKTEWDLDDPDGPSPTTTEAGDTEWLDAKQIVQLQLAAETLHQKNKPQ